VPPAPGAPSERFFAKKQAAARKTAEVAGRLTALSQQLELSPKGRGGEEEKK